MFLYTDMTRCCFIFFILLTFAGFSCKRYETNVWGEVKDGSTGSSIGGATVYLLETKNSCFTCSGSTIQRTVTGSSGVFYFDFTAHDGYSYDVAAEANNYFSNLGTGGVHLTAGQKNKLQVPLQPKAWLKIHLKNTSPFDIYDLISVSGEWNGSNWFNYYGTQVDTIVSGCPVIVTGNRNIKNYWNVTKNSVQSSYNGQIYCPRFDTTLYKINY